MTTKFVDIDNARFDDQKKVMKQIMAEGHCPFCLENLQLYHKKPFIKKGEYWWITENQWPYDNTKVHLLAISTKHAENFSELDPKAGEELFSILTELEKELQIPGGGVAIRFGDTSFSAGTVKHIHAQLIQPDITRPDFKPVRFKIGKDQEKRS